MMVFILIRQRHWPTSPLPTCTNKQVNNVPMLLDSGADVTLVPQFIAHLLKLEISPDTGYEIGSFAGDVKIVPAINLVMSFCDLTFRGQFLLIDQAWGIIGRNVLNRVVLLFDGPLLTWSKK